MKTGAPASGFAEAPEATTQDHQEQASCTSLPAPDASPAQRAAEEVRAILGLPRLSPEQQEQWERTSAQLDHARDAAAHGRHCGRCNHEFTAKEAVWWYRLCFVHPLGTYIHAFAPKCRQCSKDHGFFHKPVACEGCGRPVHLEFWRRHRPVFCCKDCQYKVKAAKAKAARTAARGIMWCECCRRKFTPTRTDSKFCKAACRQQAYRNRKLVTGKQPAARRRKIIRNSPVTGNEPTRSRRSNSRNANPGASLMREARWTLVNCAKKPTSL